MEIVPVNPGAGDDDRNPDRHELHDLGAVRLVAEGIGTLRDDTEVRMGHDPRNVPDWQRVREPNTALQPQSLRNSEGATILILGPTANCIFCFPMLVTPLTVGLKKTTEVPACQFWVYSKLAPTPAPVFQLWAKKG